MTEDFYPIPEPDGLPPSLRGGARRDGARWLARIGVVAASLALTFGIGAFGAGQLAGAGHESGVATTTQGSDQDAASPQQPGTAVPGPAGEADDDD